MLTIRQSPRSAMQIAALAALIVVFALFFRRTFFYLYANWQREEYSHGILIPLISAYLFWQRRSLVLQAAPSGSWWGTIIVGLGLLLAFMGYASSIVGTDAYALLLVVTGCVIATIGWRGLRLTWVPLALLLLMIPLPTFWYNNLSSALQLLSSRIGVAFIRACGVSVFLEGNVIDLGAYKLQVAEACSGLRYLFPLMTLGVVIGYLFSGKTWTRWAIFISTIPIAVFMNSFRIAIIGVLVDRFGSAQAEGFLHQFEGWVLFMACFLLLLLECVALLRLTGDRRRLRDALGFKSQRPAGDVSVKSLSFGKPAAAVGLLLALALYPAMAMPQRMELRPQREDFSRFPLQMGEWSGRRDHIDSVYLDELKLDDYLLADFVAPASTRAPVVSTAVNVYVAYYASQRTGQSIHSPRSCLPGGGWQIEQLDQHEIPGVQLRNRPLRVNRAIIQQGARRQLVYYWFQERGRDLTNEYLVKWFLLADELSINRSDGALIRLITPLEDGDDATAGDQRLARLSAALLPVLGRYVGG